MDALVQWFTANLSEFISKEAVIFIISMVPILELRGGLLAASPALLNVPLSEIFCQSRLFCSLSERYWTG